MTAISTAPPGTISPDISISTITALPPLTAKGTFTIKIIRGNGKSDKRQFRGSERPFQWDVQGQLFLQAGEKLTIEFSAKRLFNNHVISQDTLDYQDATHMISAEGNKQVEHKLGSASIIGIRFKTQPLNDLAKTTVARAMGQNNALDRLGRSRAFVEVLIKYGSVASELNPIAKAVATVIDGFYKYLEAQEQHDKQITELAMNMASIVEFVADVEQFATLVQLRSALEEIEPLVRKMSEVVVARALRHTIALPDSQDPFEEINRQFNQVKQRFDRGLAVQTGEIVHALTDKLDRLAAAIQGERHLERLEPKGLDVGVPIRECMQGTRADILANVNTWLQDFTAPNILWIVGFPGSGKSALAATIRERLKVERRLGSSFIFQRDNAAITTTAALWRKVAFNLAQQYPTIRSSIIHVLEETEVDNTESASSIFQRLVCGPLLKCDPSDIPHGRLPVIVIDGLDECGGLDGMWSPDRKALIATIPLWSKLKPHFKIILTSRSEHDFQTILAPNISRHVSTSSSKIDADIQHYLTTSFAEFSNSSGPYSSLRSWPGPITIQELTRQADGVFQYAITVIRFMQEGPPVDQLTSLQSGGMHGLDSLYNKILSQAFSDSSSHSIAEAFRQATSAILLANGPLSESDLTELADVSTSRVQFVLLKLRSVLDAGSLIRFSHQSFTDFLLDEKRCPGHLFSPKATRQRILALSCFKIMQNCLQFNICRIETSYLANHQIPDIDDKISSFIPTYLQYACRYWPNHLRDTAHDSELYDAVTTFITEHLLYWLEVMSLLELSGIATRALSTLPTWVQNDIKLSTAFQQAQQFVTLSGGAIWHSAPHIYLSALPFVPEAADSMQRYCAKYPGTFAVRSGLLSSPPIVRHILYGHSGCVWSVAFSPDGTRVASGSFDRTIRIWDTTTGRPIIGPLEGHTGCVNSVAFSPDGKQVASASDDNTIRIWDVGSGELVAGPFTGHTGPVQSIAFSPNRKQIVSGSKDSTILIWDIATGKPAIDALMGHTGYVTSVGFSPDGTRVVSGSDDMTVRVWDAITGKPILGPFRGHTHWINSVAFSPNDNGLRIISASNDYAIRIWNSLSGELVGRPLEGHTGIVNAAVFSPDGTKVLSGSHDRTLRIWEAATGELVAGPFEGHTDWIRSVAFSLDGTKVVSGSDDSTIRIWDTHALMGSSSEDNTSLNNVRFAALSPDGARIVSGAANTLMIWDSATGEAVTGPLTGHTGTVLRATFSPDGSRIASGSDDNTLRIWDAATGNPIIGHTKSIWPISFSPDGARVASGSTGGSLRIWDAFTGDLIVGPLVGHIRRVSSIAFSPNGSRIVSGSTDGTVRIWDLITGDLVVGPLKPESESYLSWVQFVQYSPDGGQVILGFNDGTVHTWSAITGDYVLGPVKSPDPTNRYLTAFASSPDGKMVASGFDDGHILIWASTTGQPVARPIHLHTSAIRSAVFSADGLQLLSCSQDGTICICTIPVPDSIARQDIPEPPKPEPSPVTFDYHLRMEDGWILGPNGELFFWVPPSYHAGLERPGSVLTIGKHVTRLDLIHFKHGTVWEECRR